MIAQFVQRYGRNVYSRARRSALRFAYSTRLYNWSLSAHDKPDQLLVKPHEAWSGDAGHGGQICSGVFVLGGARTPINGDVWAFDDTHSRWPGYIHSFDWLRDLRAYGRDNARITARRMVESWTALHYRWDPQGWALPLAGARIANWIAHYDFFCASADETFRAMYFDMLIRQARHISRELGRGGAESAGDIDITAIKGLVYAGLCLPGREYWAEQGIACLETALNRQIASDGGHISRSPNRLKNVICHCLDLRAVIQSAKLPVPEALQHAIDRMVPALRVFRFPDKGLGVFHDTREGDADHIDQIQQMAGVRGTRMASLPDTGFERLTQGKGCVLMDTGRAPPAGHDEHAHAGLLAFEFTCGKDRIFVNCGTHPVDEHWREMLRGTAAHTTLTLDHRNAEPVGGDGAIHRRARTLQGHREDRDGASLIDACHDGYYAINGITHRRRVYLGENGRDLRGEDSLTCTPGLDRAVEVAIRFHLHPTVKASLIRDGMEGLLRTPSGTGWRFCHNGGQLALEDSIYLGGDGVRPQKARQLVIHACMQDSDHVVFKWACQKEG